MKAQETQAEHNDMGKHTAGPWEIESFATKYPDLRTYNVNAPKAWMQDDGTFRECCVVSELDSEPDARLIAAAPDLLAAASTAALMIRGDIGRGGRSLTLRCADAREILLAAIAKATTDSDSAAGGGA